MSKLVEKLKNVNFHGIGTCSDAEICDAEQELKLNFPEEYKAFLKAFKAGSFLGHEWMGIQTLAYLDTVHNTKFNQENDDMFPVGCFVLENEGIEGLLVICDAEGTVYSYCGGKAKVICDSLEAYAELCVKENN